jgi:hypothetical protein
VIQSAVFRNFDEVVLISTIKKYEQVMLSVPIHGRLPTGDVVLEISYTGSVSSAESGLIRSNGLYWTHFESTFARMVFPCFDTPEYKVPFYFTLTLDKLYNTVLSNTPRRTIEQQGNLFIYTFQPTPPLPTYLFAFSFGNFQTRSVSTNQMMLTSYTTTTPNPKSLQVAKNITEWCTNYFNLPLQTTKIDFVSVPSFVYGAMENAFLIVFDDMYFINDDNEAYETIIHEVIHQWIGNRMTIRWWSHTWIKEGLTTFLQVLYMNGFDEFYANQVPEVHQMDSITGSHPLYDNVNTTSQIENIFDEISYDKGALWFRMTYELLGKDLFHSWMLEIVTYPVIAENMLLQSFASRSNVTSVANLQYWIHTAGFPVLSFETVNTTFVRVVQERYYSYYPLIKINSKWNIPYEWIGIDGSLTQSPAAEMIISSNFLKINPNQVYNIRVNYPLDVWTRIGQNIASPYLTSLDKIGLINDAISLAKTGELEIMTTFQFLSGFKAQFDQNMWTLILKFFKQIHFILFLDPNFLREKFDTFVVGSLPVSDNSLIQDAQSWFQNETFVRNIFNQYTPFNASMFPCDESSQIIFNTLIRYGDVSLYRAINTHYENTLCNYALLALAESKDVNLLKSTSELSLSLPKIQGVELLSRVIRNPYGILMVWDYVRENIAEIQSVFGHWLIEKHLVSEFAKMFYEKERIKEFRDTFGNMEDVSIEDSIEIIRSNMHFVDQCKDDLIRNFL